MSKYCCFCYNTYMKKDHLYLFDLDGTLFDPSIFLQIILHRYAEQFVSDERVLLQVAKAYRGQLEKGSDFDPAHFLDLVSDKIHAPIEKLTNIFWHETTAYTQAVFLDVFPVLEVLQKRNIQLGIFSEGQLEYQKQKLSQSGLMKFFDQASLHIFQRKLLQDNLSLLPKESVVIDNQKDIVLTLQKNKIETIWINRKSEEKLVDMQTINTLQELI